MRDGIAIVNPATGAPVGEVPDQPPPDVEAAVARARAAQPAWAALPFTERGRLLRRLSRRLIDDPTLMDTLTSESGKPRYEAEAIELFYTCELTRYVTGRAGRRALRDELRRPFVFANKRARVVHHPRGVIGVIGPWNWPLLNNFADCITPLACGNTVVLKPSEVAPLTSLHVGRLWREAGLPDGVLEVVTGGAPAGRALCDHVDMVFFTGGHATGKEVAQRAAERMIPIVLELGGKSPMIVLADADLPRAARAAVWSAFAHSGQVCIRTERVLVEAPVADRFVDLCAQEMTRLRAGVDVGAVTSRPLIDRVEQQIADAVARGARVVLGGKARADTPGQFFQPTLLAGAQPDMAVMNDETFGPVLPVMAVSGVDEALRIANASRFGLSGSVWSRDTARARDVARRLHAGSVCVNDALFNYFAVEAPIGGVKASGLGVRHGPEAMRQFCRVETILEDHPLLGFLSPFLASQLGFPYRSRSLRLIRRLMRWLY